MPSVSESESAPAKIVCDIGIRNTKMFAQYLHTGRQSDLVSNISIQSASLYVDHILDCCAGTEVHCHHCMVILHFPWV